MLKYAKKMQKRTIFLKIAAIFAFLCAFLRNFAAKLQIR